MKLLDNGLLYNDGIVVGSGDRIRSSAHIPLTITWSGLTQVTTTMKFRYLYTEVMEREDIIIDSLYTEEFMESLEEFLLPHSIVRDGNRFYKDSEGRLLEFVIGYGTTSNPLIPRTVEYFMGSSDRSVTVKSKGFTYLEFNKEKKEINFFYNRYIGVTKGMTIFEVDGKLDMKILEL